MFIFHQTVCFAIVSLVSDMERNMRCINSGQDSEQHHDITEGLEVKCTTRHW